MNTLIVTLAARQKFMDELKKTQNMKLVKTQASISRRSLEADMASKEEEERARVESMSLRMPVREADVHVGWPVGAEGNEGR